MVKASADDIGGKLDNLLASRRFLAFDSEVLMKLQVDRPRIPMELQVDRQVLPMEQCQLKVNRKGYKIEKKKLIDSNFEESTLP